ncbi:hypothetical protein [Dactylosporangium sp. CA-139066]|uniref:hypothetical protein n=1 Tax=Dactylosporangium sp. CA-139066 TaxID=3239930 RepID=UPI003D8EA33F
MALLLDSVELSEAGRGLEAVGALSDALRRAPMEAMSAVIGFMRGGVHALAYTREEEFPDTLRWLRFSVAQ